MRPCVFEKLCKPDNPLFCCGLHMNDLRDFFSGNCLVSCLSKDACLSWFYQEEGQTCTLLKVRGNRGSRRPPSTRVQYRQGLGEQDRRPVYYCVRYEPLSRWITVSETFGNFRKFSPSIQMIVLFHT